jgi:rubrerythrin
MYVAYDAVAKLQGNESARTSIRYALNAEKDHQGIYDNTLRGVEGRNDLGDGPVRVCPICGHTVIGEAPDECPRCGTAGTYFRDF